MSVERRGPAVCNDSNEGLRLCERGGKNAKKRAEVAVARKLAVLLHSMWVSGEVYEPLRNAMAVAIAPPAAA